MIDVTAFGDRESLMHETATRIEKALKKGILERGEGFAALSGGSTPEAAYEELASRPYHWPHVTFLLVDERFVPLTDGASNESMLRRSLAPALAAGAKLLPMFADGVSLSEAAARADATYATKPIDIALMGMGSDGHTASWFPHSPQLPAALDRTNPRSVIDVTSPNASGSPQRLTLTRSALSRANTIALLITGTEKRMLLRDETRSDLPVDALFDIGPRVDVLWSP